MIGSRTLLATAAVLGLAAPTLAQAPDPIIRAGATEQIAPHVWVIEDESVPLVPNVGFVVGETAALVIETGLGPRNGEIVLAEAQALAPGLPLYIVSTHFHPEHDLGAQAFPDEAQMIRSNAQARDVAELGEETIAAFSGRSALTAELLADAEHREADILFDGEHRLDLGGVSVVLLDFGANHTRGDTAVWVEGEGVLFAGDVAMSALPAITTEDATVAQWLASLDRLDALSPTVVVPSHGPLGDAGYIAAYRDFFETVRDRAAALKAEGKTVEETIETVTAEIAAARPGISAQRAAGGIRLAYAEAP
jgi:glyoxylase-like metal-dependent hydrolase (beta-lactamase superfamily II)